MPKVKLKCKVCGKEYEACRTPNPTGMHRWRDVACSRECYMEWIRRIELSRATTPEPVTEPVQPAAEPVVDEAPDTFAVDTHVEMPVSYPSACGMCDDDALGTDTDDAVYRDDERDESIE